MLTLLSAHPRRGCSFQVFFISLHLLFSSPSLPLYFYKLCNTTLTINLKDKASITNIAFVGLQRPRRSDLDDNIRTMKQSIHCVFLAQLLLSIPVNALPRPFDSVVHSLKAAIPQPVSDLAGSWSDYSYSLFKRDNTSSSGNGSENISSSQNPNASAVWVLQDTYAGETFFECAILSLYLLP